MLSIGTTDEMDGRRWNRLIDAVNQNMPPESVIPPMNEKEKQIFHDMEKQLAEMRRINPKAFFWPVEID